MSKKVPFKKFKVLTGTLFTGLSLPLLMSSPVKAGPMIEFGDEGYLQIDLRLQVYVENTDIGSGANRESSRTDIHFQRMRLTMTGMINDTWGVRFQTCGNPGTTKSALGYMYSQATNDLNDRDIRIIDAYIIGNFHPSLNMKLGLTKIPLTRANLDECFAPLSLDRSMFVYTPYGGSPIKFSRDFGVVFWGTFLEDRLKYWVGILEGREGDTTWELKSPTALNQYVKPDVRFKSSPEPQSNFEYVVRAHYSFLDPEPGGSGYLGTYFGKKKILTIGAGFAYEPKMAYKNVGYDYVNNTYILKNKKTVDYKAYALDLLFEYPFSFGVVTLNGQYLKVDLDDAYKTNKNPADRNSYIAGLNGQKEGGFVKLAYMPPVTFLKEGKIQPYLLYEHWDFAHLLGVDMQTIKQYGGGINFYIMGQNVRITGEYLKTDFDKKTWLIGLPTGKKVDNFNTYRMMFQLAF